jgi:hypothetical protein
MEARLTPKQLYDLEMKHINSSMPVLGNDEDELDDLAEEVLEIENGIKEEIKFKKIDKSVGKIKEVISRTPGK